MNVLNAHLEVIYAAQSEEKKHSGEKAFGIKKKIIKITRVNIRAVMTAASIQLRIRGGGS